MARFEIKTVRILDADGEEREYEVIVDRSSLGKVLLHAPADYVTVGEGFLRCKGKQFVGVYGRSQPVYAGSDDDTYYAGVSLFDGEWSHRGTSRLGTFAYVTTESGTGKLWRELEEFCREAGVAAK